MTPEPTEYRNWEVYLGADYTHAAEGADASLPLAEFNYVGALIGHDPHH